MLIIYVCVNIIHKRLKAYTCINNHSNTVLY